MTKSAHAERIYSTAMLEPLVGALRRAGLSPERALRAAGLREEDVISPETRVSIDQTLLVYQSIVAETQDPMLAYRLGLAFHVTTYGMYGFAVLSSADGRQALEIALQYHRLGSPLVRPRLSVEGPSTRWIFSPLSHPRMVAELYEFVVRLHVGIFVRLYDEVVGDDLAGVGAGLAFDLALDEAAMVEQLTGLKVEQAQGEATWIRVDSARLGRPTRMGSPAVNRALLQICDDQIAALRRREGLAGRLRTILIMNGCRVLSQEAAARRLGMTERTLRRRLAEEGASFRAVHDDVQLQAAIGYLRDTELTVEVIAETLGFSDAANFRRAFRRWTGRPPLDYRRHDHDGRRAPRAARPSVR
jgi:AraC-like DNA-binding protein